MLFDFGFFWATSAFVNFPHASLSRYVEDMKTESRSSSNNNNSNDSDDDDSDDDNKSPAGRRIKIEDIRYARKRVLSGFCDGVVVASAFGESSSPPVVVSEEEYLSLIHI